jgi:glutathione S-transferase
VKHEFHNVDQFKGDHKKEPYLSLNPTGSIPTLTEGRFLVLGGYLVFLNYLGNYHKTIKEKLYPSSSRNEIDKSMLWY